MSIPASLPQAFPMRPYNPRFRQSAMPGAFPSPAFLAANAAFSAATGPQEAEKHPAQPALPAGKPGQSTGQSKGMSAEKNAASTGKDKQNGLMGGRTKGMWLFDTLLYPGLTNAAVFAISVLATYATTHGAPGNMMRKRGDAVRQWMQKKFNMKENTARETVMISFSFLDGCVMAPVVKWFEDRRMGVVKRFDRWMGNTPQDPTVYDKEPKQSWGSVLGGRTAAFALVVPTAKLMSIKTDGVTSFNDRMFAQPGKKVGEALLKKWPKLAHIGTEEGVGLMKKLPKLNVPGLMEVCFMEGFYTAICTAGLYLSSRFLANRHQKNQQPASAFGEAGWVG